jgi:hypothetical protein
MERIYADHGRGWAPNRVEVAVARGRRPSRSTFFATAVEPASAFVTLAGSLFGDRILRLASPRQASASRGWPPRLWFP